MFGIAVENRIIYSTLQYHCCFWKFSYVNIPYCDVYGHVPVHKLFQNLSSLQKYLAGIMVWYSSCWIASVYFWQQQWQNIHLWNFCSIKIILITLFYSCSSLLLPNMVLQSICLQFLIIPWCFALLGKLTRVLKARLFTFLINRFIFFGRAWNIIKWIILYTGL